jgi:hypothetical protein|tara:strand:- start:4262 stop:4654 length:393 start_codon:yes stop_codon:yes gene_type:complete
MGEFDSWVEIVYNDVMEMKNTLMFAPGWFQDISTTSEDEEKQDLLIYLSDTHKMLYGVRCRYYNMEDPIQDIRDAADRMQQEVVEEAEWERKEAHEKMLEANRVAVLYRAAKKPVSRTFKPFANLKEMLV